MALVMHTHLFINAIFWILKQNKLHFISETEEHLVEKNTY